MEHARGTPRGEDLRRDLDRGYSIPRRSGGGGGGGGSRDRSVVSFHICNLSLVLSLVYHTAVKFSYGVHLSVFHCFYCSTC